MFPREQQPYITLMEWNPANSPMPIKVQAAGGKAMNKAFVFRIYPNKEQRILLVKTFGCAGYTVMVVSAAALWGYPSNVPFGCPLGGSGY